MPLLESGTASTPLWMREAAQAGLRTAEALPTALPDGVAEFIGSDLAREFSLLPLKRNPDGRLTLVTATARRTALRRAELEYALGPVELLAGEPAAVLALIAHHYDRQGVPTVAEEALDFSKPFLAEEMTRGEGVARYVDGILAYAARLGASDVHFEPTGKAFRVRLRVDGAMRCLPELPSAAGAALLTRLKLLAGLDIGVSRRAQDGRMRIAGRDLRLATLPCAAGESAVVRLLDSSKGARSLAELGMPDACRSALDAASRGQGLILSCGPTGSGKTTTLHAALSHLDAAGRKILTVEDPVEYELENAVQVQARPEIGLGFAEALRSFLRHDPDIILVGEIRDAATARIAMQAALTGHLVYASLHCRGAAEAPLRLVELGVEAWLVGSALELAIAQRLVRRVCRQCAGTGCEACGHTGYSGRTALFEWLRMNPALATLLDAGRLTEYVDAAREQMPTTMAAEGLALVATKLTTRAELAAQVDLPGSEGFIPQPPGRA